GTGYPNLVGEGEPVGTEDGFAMAPYIREARRLVARTIVTEGHVGTEQRRLEGRPAMDATEFGSAHPFEDSVGIGHYSIDFHPSCSGRNSLYVPAAPFRIPLGALIPVRVRNVIAAGKCLGVTHVTNGCYRLHPVEWNVGEAAGHLATWCLEHDSEPQAIHDSVDRTRAFQNRLREHGVLLSWPWEH
ncbi:MAG: FAD-dependent oxidoreductase, partial [Phycisphaerales bacterium]|nr:FAD-dependent oxidoreductase [Phycisphaerales bacterium]